MPAVLNQSQTIQLHSSRPGLSSQEAALRLERFGPNDPSPKDTHSFAIDLFKQFGSPLVMILLIASAVSAVLHDVASAGIICVIVLMSVALNYFHSIRSRLAAASLRSQVVITATVLRDDQWIEVPRRDVVPGDLVKLVAGDLVPADAVLLESKDLHAQQSTLTGESFPVDKQANPAVGNQALELDNPSAVFYGTSIVSGTATAEIVNTGLKTVYGDIAERLARRPPETEFDRGVRRFSFLIMQTVLVLVCVIFLSSAILHREPLQSLLFAVALAVGLTPEFLPMIVSVTLARGAEHMGQKNVIVKDLAAMQNFGSIDILCSDKTGTLTEGTMELEQCVDPAGQKSEHVFLLAYLNSVNESGIKSPLDEAILRKNCVACAQYQKVDEIPFDFDRRRLSVVVEKNGQRQLITKGAPEGILAICEDLDRDGQKHELQEAERRQCLETFQKLSSQGYRVLGVAYRDVPALATYHAEAETNLTFAGYAVFADRIRADSGKAIQALAEDGVQVKILTGDNELVTQHVCHQLGLEANPILLGADLDRMSEAALAHAAENVTAFARLSPRQKNRVILALKSRGHVIGYLGDGINDAPSLHTADVGISVNSAVEVARDAADIILLERSLSVLHAGILEGRRAFGNVMKYLLMGTSSNFGNMFSMAVASIFLPFLPMLPMQILLNNFLYDLAQVTIPTDNVDDSFLHKPRKWDVRLIRDFMVIIGPISSLFDLLTFAVLIYLFQASEDFFHTGWFVESLVTQTLVLFVIRTAGNPFRSRPSIALMTTVSLVAIIAMLLPFTPLATALGLVPLPITYYCFLLVATASYLLLVEAVKRWMLEKYLE